MTSPRWFPMNCFARSKTGGRQTSAARQQSPPWSSRRFNGRRCNANVVLDIFARLYHLKCNNGTKSSIVRHTIPSTKISKRVTTLNQNRKQEPSRVRSFHNRGSRVTLALHYTVDLRNTTMGNSQPRPRPMEVHDPKHARLLARSGPTGDEVIVRHLGPYLPRRDRSTA
jgi:hypothetical protein